MPDKYHEIEKNSSIKNQNMDNCAFDALRTEYDMLTNRIEGTYSRLIQLVIFLIGGLGAALSFYLQNHVNNEYILIILSAVIIVLGGIIVNLFSDWSNLIFQIRKVSERIVEITQEKPIEFFFHTESMPSRFQSLRRGNQKFRFMLYLLLFIGIAFFVVALVFSAIVIYSHNHLLSLVFSSFILIIISIMFLSVYSILFELPKFYDQTYYQIIEGENGVIKTEEIIRSESNIFNIILPRPLDFMTKTWLFLAGAVIILFENPAKFNSRIPDILLPIPIGQIPLPPYPFWTIIAFSLIWFLIQEGILQQAKYIWNDIRDKDKDKGMYGKEDRLITKSHESMALFSLFSRLIIGLLLGFFLDIRLFWILIVITLLQLFYELFAKPRAKEQPLLSLLIVSIGTVIRVAGGGLSVGAEFRDIRFLSILVVFFFWGIGTLSTFWKVETEQIKNYQPEKEPRAQGEYFLKYGVKFQEFGFMGAIICSLFCITYLLFRVPIDNLLNSLQKTSTYILPVFYVYVLVFLSIISILLITIFIYKPLSWLLLKSNEKKLLPVFLSFFFISLAIVQFILKPATDLHFFIAGILLIFSVILFINYFKIDYEEYMLINLRRNYKFILLAWYKYFFKSDTNIHLNQLISLSIIFAKKRIEDLPMEFKKLIT